MQIKFVLFAIFICYVVAINATNEYKVIETVDGPIRGERLLSTLFNKPYYSFKGVPYAAPPIGELRFKPPQKVTPWKNVRDTLTFGNQCLQPTRKDDYVIVGDEDCLYLNIDVPDVPSGTKLPVMVFLHSGGYYYGSGEYYRPDFLVSNDVILITINYRLGILGFLSLGTPEYSGNMGMKDQREVLYWVQNNIEKFGGDKQRITLFGESAGAVSAHLHMFSPASKHLFQRIILQSGSAITTWSYHTKSDYLEQLHQIANDFGHKISGNDDLMEFYYRVDPKVLIRETNRKFYIVGADNRIDNMVWEPLVEIPNAINPFITKYPEEYLLESTNDKIDMLTGFMSNEMYFALYPEYHNPKYLEPFNDKFKIQLPWPLLKTDFNSNVYKQISKEIRDFYIPNGGAIDNHTIYEYSKLMDDLTFNYGQYKAAVLDVKRAPNLNAYFYIFSIKTDLNAVQTAIGINHLNLPGGCHLEDLYYMFKLSDDVDPFFYYPYEKLSTDSVEFEKIQFISKMWSDFAKYGHPTPHDKNAFKRMTPSTFNYVNISNDGLVAGVNPYAERMHFWDNLYKKYKNSLKPYLIKDLTDPYVHSEL